MARIYEVLPLIGPEWGSPMRLIAFVTETELVQGILQQVGELTAPPPILRLRQDRFLPPAPCRFGSLGIRLKVRLLTPSILRR